MSKNKHANPQSQYLPDMRTGYSPTKSDLVSSSPEGITTTLANTVTDDIVVNNIAWQEFDYTEEPYVDSELDTNP